MRIRGRKPPLAPHHSAAVVSLSSSSPCSSSSSITATHPSPSSSSSSSSSIASSQDSSSSNSSFNISTHHRCHGLDLLVKAIHQVTAGSIIGVPYIQRRVTIRRRRALQFHAFTFDGNNNKKNKKKKNNELNSTFKKMNSRIVGLPPMLKDSILQLQQPWGRRRSAHQIVGL